MATASHPAEGLLRFERAVRSAQSLRELGFVAVNDDVRIAINRQTTDGQGWTVQAHNSSGVFATVEARVLCLKVSTGS